MKEKLEKLIELVESADNKRILLEKKDICYLSSTPHDITIHAIFINKNGVLSFEICDNWFVNDKTIDYVIEHHENNLINCIDYLLDVVENYL